MVTIHHQLLAPPTVAAIAASENRAVATIDFPGAFLNSDMPLDGDHAVLMRLNK